MIKNEVLEFEVNWSACISGVRCANFYNTWQVLTTWSRQLTLLVKMLFRYQIVWRQNGHMYVERENVDQWTRWSDKGDFYSLKNSVGNRQSEFFLESKRFPSFNWGTEISINEKVSATNVSTLHKQSVSDLHFEKNLADSRTFSNGCKPVPACDIPSPFL